MHPDGAVDPALAGGVPVDRKIADRAALWLARLGADDVSAQDIRDCADWRAQDAEHERAWQRAVRVGARLGLIPAHIGKPVLLRSDASRRAALKALMLLIVAPPIGWLALEATPWRTWNAELRTATGERRELVLADGTHLHLNTASAVDLRFDTAQRLLILRDGEILVDTASDPARPFRVQTEHGTLHALGTRFTVRREPAHTRLAVFEGRVEIRPGDAADIQVLEPGEQTVFSATGIASRAEADDASLGWTRGVLHARRMPLVDFLAELSRYREGVLRCDPAVARLPVSGLFSLDDTDIVLRNLAEALPIRIRRRSAWWTVVEPGSVAVGPAAGSAAGRAVEG